MTKTTEFKIFFGKGKENPKGFTLPELRLLIGESSVEIPSYNGSIMLEMIDEIEKLQELIINRDDAISQIFHEIETH